MRKKRKKFNYAGVDVEKALAPEKDVKSEETVEVKSLVVIPPKKEQVKRTRSARKKKDAGKGKAKRTDKSNEPAKLSEKIAEAKPPSIKKSEITNKDEKDLKCLYHPESPAVDMQRQLCSSCRWKLRSNGLTEYDKDPAVVSFLKGETKSLPSVGQPMCPVHPEVPAYNKKTGLCQRCQSKAKAIGVTDRHLTKKELTKLRNPS